MQDPTQDNTPDSAERLVGASDAGTRLDAYIAEQSETSRAQVVRWIQDGHVTLNKIPSTKVSRKVQPNDRVAWAPPSPVALGLVAQDIPLTIVHEDAHLIVINKPAGLVVHPGAGHPDGTLVNALLHHCDDLSGIGGTLRPGIVHRIDKDTSGLIVATKTDAAHQALQAQFVARTVDRSYIALCAHVTGQGLPDTIRIETQHGRHPKHRRRFTGLSGPRHAVTNVEVVERFSHGALLARCTLETGRTHQIRVHLTERGCPLLGDELYAPTPVAGSRLMKRTALHAATLGFQHVDGTRLHFTSSPPPDFENALDRLRNGASWR